MACALLVTGMVLTDEDPRSVSLQEWLVLGLALFAAQQAIRRILKAYQRGSWN